MRIYSAIQIGEYHQNHCEDHIFIGEYGKNKNQLLLDPKELLSTLIIMLCDTTTQQGMVLVIGDGLVVINGVKHSFEQNNTPDYIGYHLDKDFETFYHSQKQKLTFDSIIDISIATDGIFSFQDIEKKGLDESTIIDFFATDTIFSDKDEMLYLKLKAFENTYGIKPTDDFAMIRVVK